MTMTETRQEIAKAVKAAGGRVLTCDKLEVVQGRERRCDKLLGNIYEDRIEIYCAKCHAWHVEWLNR